MSTPVDAAGLHAHYEALRQEALGALPDGPPGHGLALFLLRGMNAWCAALTALGPRAAAHAPADAADDCRVPTEMRSTLTTVLASMVLACLPKKGVAC
jgi:hypothetical protein